MQRTNSFKKLLIELNKLKEQVSMQEASVRMKNKSNSPSNSISHKDLLNELRILEQLVDSDGSKKNQTIENSNSVTNYEKKKITYSLTKTPADKNQITTKTNQLYKKSGF